MSSLPSADPANKLFPKAFYAWASGTYTGSTDAVRYSDVKGKMLNPKDNFYPNDDFNPLMLAASIGDVEITKYLLGCGVDANTQGQTTATPQVTALHIAVRGGYLDIVKLLCDQTNIDINRPDQYGFVPLVYAIIARNKEIILYLTSHGASTILASKAGSTPLDIAKSLNYDDIVDILLSKTNSETDPTLPQFRNWLCSLGAGEYLPKFVDAGYDLRFIVKQGLTDQDLDCIGIPMSKLGIRRKITTLHKLSEFYTAEDEEEGGGEEEEEVDEEEGEEDGDEEAEED